nr:probable carbohydrate esterase At4g34215 [Ipomoea batatas]
MAGRGNILTLKNNSQIWDGVTPPGGEPNPSILRYTPNFSWELAHEPLHADIDVTKSNVCGVGPGMAFANQLLKRDTTVGMIGLVPCAIGGTTMKEWLPGTANYNRLIMRASVSVQGAHQIRALLWFQGESDADVPSAIKGLYVNDIRKFQLELKLPSLSTVDANGSELQDDRVHLNSTAQVHLGIRMADAFLQMSHH